MIGFKILKTITLTVIATMVSIAAFSQAGSGEIYGTVSDKSGPLPGASIKITSGGILKYQKKTDATGKYSIKPVPAGDYELEASFIGIGKKKISFYLATDATSKQNIVIGGKDEDEGVIKKGTIVIKAAKPLLSTETPPSGTVIGGAQINNQATRSTGDIANLGTGVLTSGKAGDNSKVSIDGGRDENTIYIIDGVQVRGSRNVNLPIGSISAIEVMGSGLPAKYGDATGGVISLTTKGISRDRRGGIYLERSVEGYGHNQVSVNLAGPLIMRKDKASNTKSPIAGFFIAADYIDNKDGDPNYYKNAYLNPDKLAMLRANPLTRSIAGGVAFQNNADFITQSDIMYSKARQNARGRSAQIVTKLDFMPNLQTNITVGLQLNYNQGIGWSRANAILAPEANAQSDSYTGRGYVRFTKRILDADNSDNPNAKDPIKNVYFTGQLSYQRDFNGSKNVDHKENLFNYGYIGKFTETRTPFFAATAIDSLSGRRGVKLLGYGATGLTFERSELNPLLANYTTYVMNNATVRNLQDVQNYNGLRNGDGPTGVYSNYANVGAMARGYSKSQGDQVSLNLETGFSWTPGKGKTVHNIEIGGYYEQRNDRFYSLAPAGLWNLMRLTANRHLANLDLANPIFRINGQNYTNAQIQAGAAPFTSYDTILYNPLYNASTQALFDKNLRKKLGLAVNGTEHLQIDAMDPSLFSVDMFSADDLLNQGQSYVTYSGYTHTGQIDRSKVSFNSFFLDKDETGNYTRKIGAFQPVYAAAYIMDKFRFRDISLNFGLRIDRYDANTKVMRDPYSLYAVRTVADLANSTYSTLGGIGVPSNMGSDYVVYVNQNSSKPTIAGYRNGDRWYDPYGREVNDPKILQEQYTNNTNNLQPYLQDKTDDIQKATSEMLNRSFQDYKPQVSVSPRLQFSFPVNDNSLLYAHYDVVVQRPKGTNTTGIGNINYMNPVTYYFFEQDQSSWLANPNLKPERLLEYELGFQQVISKESRTVLTLSGYYKERKDQIQVRPYFYAYPKTYNAFGNRDFSTAKGFRVKLESNMGKSSNIMVSYQLGFSEGTGSSTTSQVSLIRSGQGSLRPTAFYLNNDVRHNIKVNVYTQIDLNDGTSNLFRKIINGIGLNGMINLRSGTPYTKYAIPIVYGGSGNGDPIIGTLNGSRLPWVFNFDVKANKDIVIRKGRMAMDGKKARNPMVINVFAYVQNVFNIKNVLDVYNFTSSASDDGYLNSTYGQQAIGRYAAAQQQSYIDMYNLTLYNQPGFFNTPRRINLGLSYNF